MSKEKFDKEIRRYSFVVVEDFLQFKRGDLIHPDHEWYLTAQDDYPRHVVKINPDKAGE